MGLPGTDIPEFSWIKPVLKPERIAYIGLRDIDTGERKILKENSACLPIFLANQHSLMAGTPTEITAYSMHHVDKFGIGRVVEMALDAVNPDRSRPIHLSFDVDACDPSVAPSTGTPVSLQLVL